MFAFDTEKFPDGMGIPLKIAAIYAVAAGLWILFSDELLAWLANDPATLTRLSIVKGWFFVVITAVLLYLLVKRYITLLRYRDQHLQQAVQGVATATGEEFFASLVQQLASVLNADFVLVGELAGEDRGWVQTIAVYGDGQPQKNFTYELAGTPCEDVIGSSTRGCSYPSGLREKFPANHLFADMGMESFIGTPLCDSGGHPLGVISVLSRRPMKDLATAQALFRIFAVRAAAELERRQADEALREVAVKYRIVADNTYDWEFWTDPDGRFIYTSPSCQRLTGHPPADFISDPGLVDRLVHPDDRTLFAGHNHAMRSDSTMGEMEFRIVHPDGGIRWIHHVCQPVFDDDGTFLGRRGSNRDITGRKETEDALKAQFEQISTIFDSLNAIVCVADMENDTLLYLNHYGVSLFGQDWQGKTCSDVLRPGRQGGRTFCPTNRLVQDGEPQPPCVWEFQNSVTGRWYQCTDRAIRWPDGRLVRLEIAVDISERREMEGMKDEMISAVSHEMRTPLTAMLGFTEFMLENEVDADQRRAFLTTIHKESARLNELISNFLDLQQIKARQTTYRFRPVALPHLLRDAAALFAADYDRHRITVDCPFDLPPIQGDEKRLHQVLANLISNAVKYSPQGSHVALGARREGELVILWVKDEGMGIPLELQERIFDRFYRLDNTDRRLVGGAGLGLALVREIVSAHGGRVWVESTPGKGSTFYVSLPASRDGEVSSETP